MFYKFVKFNIAFCTKVTGETFSSHHKRKRAEGARYKSIQTFRRKDRYRTELWRASVEAPKGQFLFNRKFLTESTFKKVIS